jgi:hypothetical protein
MGSNKNTPEIKGKLKYHKCRYGMAHQRYVSKKVNCMPLMQQGMSLS